MTDGLPAQARGRGAAPPGRSEGGFGTILKRGDPDRGALVLLIASAGCQFARLERALVMAHIAGRRWPGGRRRAGDSWRIEPITAPVRSGSLVN